MNVGFRVDGGPKIGLGHLMRTIALAREFKNRGHDIFFITNSVQYVKPILKDDYRILELDTDYGKNFETDVNHLDHEIKKLKKIISENDIKVLIIDSYQISEKYLLEIKKFSPFLCYIDDYMKIKYDVDMLINGNVYGQEIEYQSYNQEIVLLLGTEYTILREEFRGIEPIRIKPTISSIFITAGGNDPHKFIKRIIKLFDPVNDLRKYQLNVIIGSAFESEYITELNYLKNENINFYDNPGKISEIMLNSDIALSGGGSTLYELSICGIPILAVIFADNQEENIKKMYSLKCVEMIGWYNEINDDDLVDKITKVIEGYEYRQELQRNQLKLFDGKGVERIVNEVIKQLKQKNIR